MLKVISRKGLHSLQRPVSLRTKPLCYVSSKKDQKTFFSTTPTLKNQPNSPTSPTSDWLSDTLRKLKMHPDQLIAKPGFNRAWLVPAATINHLFLGAIFAFSIFNDPLTELGWFLQRQLIIFS
eukprot:TRINITY_DN1615_c0_g1_i2.p1 TRINITY_DN1615_c0_g1~~TRINITY_DN1615_c0_g1_i2.p1  ORF type:complete len:123 (+),score=8.07 TRINITY_DN1615_c0_g1_i2:102-470(+)